MTPPEPDHDPHSDADPTTGAAPTGGGWPNWQPPPATEVSAVPDRQSLWRPAIISAFLLIGLLYGNVALAFGISASDETFSDVFGVLLAAVPIVGILLCFFGRTRRWGQGILLGIPLALGALLVIGGGLCVVLIAGGDL